MAFDRPAFVTVSVPSVTNRLREQQGLFYFAKVILICSLLSMKIASVLPPIRSISNLAVAARTHPSPKLRSSPFQGDHAAFPSIREDFSKGSLANAHAASHKENAGTVLIIRVRHEAIRARLASVLNLPRNKKRASPRRPMDDGCCCDFRENRARETTLSAPSAPGRGEGPYNGRS